MTKTHKEIILAIFIVLFGAITWFFLHQFFYFGEKIISLIFTILGFLFWGISIGLGSLLINKKVILYSAFVLSLLSFFIFFHGGNVMANQFREAFYYFIVLVLIFISLIFYQKRVKHEEKARIKLHFWRIFKKGLPLVFTFVCILVSLAYYFSPSLGTSKIKLEIPQSLFDAILKPIEGLIQEKLPQGINLDIEVDKILPFDQKKDMEKQFGIKVEKGDTGRDVLYKLVNTRITSLGGAYKNYIPIALAIGLFFVLRIVSILLIAFVVLFSYFAVRILIAMGFAKIVTKSIEMEDIEV